MKMHSQTNIHKSRVIAKLIELWQSKKQFCLDCFADRIIARNDSLIGKIVCNFCNINILIGIFIFTIALLYRVSAINTNIPFWVDEFSTGTSARLIQEKGLGIYLNPPSGFETNNSLTYVITAIFFSLFGQTEGVARIPAMLIGALVPIAVYFIAKKLSGSKAGIVGAVLTSLSYFQIVWSLQARSYMMLQLTFVLTLLIGMKMVSAEKIRIKDLVFLVVVAIFGLASHYLYIIALGVTVGYVILTKRKQIIDNKKATLALLFASVLAFAFFWFVGFIKSVWSFVNSSFFLSNNLGYYHSFLWREYGLLLLLAIFGFALIARRHGKYVGLLSIYFFTHLIFVTFFFGHHMSKYLLPIFPILFIGTGVFLAEFGEIIAQRVGEIKIARKFGLSLGVLGIIVTFGFLLFIIGNGHKFVTKPKKYYSINHDFREIANIDYHEVYRIVKNSVAVNKNSKVALIETWPGRAYWYLKQDYEPLYVFRWQSGEDLVNGHTKKMEFTMNKDGEKRLTDKIGFVAEEKDLKLVMKKYPKGYIFIDDDTMPREVIDYAEKNLKKEIFLDHYPLDDNPYSKWPATLYSWGMEGEQK